jgi:hypothetical protein
MRRTPTYVWAEGESDVPIALPDLTLESLQVAMPLRGALRHALAGAHETLADLGAPALLEHVSLYVATPHDWLLRRC